MSEAWASVSEQQVQAVKDVAVSNALSLLTQEVWAIMGLTLLGMAVGMASVGVVRMFLSPVDGEGPAAWERRSRLLTQLGAVAAGLMTLWIELAYLGLVVKMNVLLSLPVALITAIIAAACNKQAFKPVKAIWRWALAKLRKKIEADQGEGAAVDLTETKYTPPKP